MRLAEDRRARVPFALIAVVLLISSMAVTTTLSTRDPPQIDRAVDESLDRVDADTRLTIRTAVADAAQAAAREPVTSTADTPAGRVLNDSEPFRDALRVRIYLRTRDRLSLTRYRRDGVTARATLPATPDEAALRAAKHRVDVESVANGTAMRVTVRDVTLTAERADETVASERETYTVTVDTPVLALHDRATRFEARLNRGPTDGPGLGRQLTARLYPIAWSRGALQYGGAPIQNVVTNRHVALAANGGVLATQRAVFGRTDPDADDAYRRAQKHAALTDVIAPTPLDAERTADAVLESPNPPGEQVPTVDRRDRSPDAAGLERTSESDPDDELIVGVNRSADRALLAVHDDDPGIEALIDEQYRATVRLETRVEPIEYPAPAEPSPPGGNWTLAAADAQRTSRVETAPAPLPAVTDGRVLQTRTREVVQRIEVERTWRRGGEISRTRSTRTRVVRVGIAVVGEHTPPGRAPDRPVRPPFRRGGAINGSNLATVRQRASTMVEDRGGPDAVARRAAAGDRPDRAVPVEEVPPSKLAPWVRHDIVALGAAVRNVSVAVDRGAVATGEANPPRRLAETLRDRRVELLDAPATYDGVADRARVAARAAYLDAVVADLEKRAERHDRANDQLREASDEARSGRAPAPDEALDDRSRAVDPDRHLIGDDRPEDGPPTGTVAVVPDGEPVYLARSAVDRGRTDPYPPLATRNLNLFTVPYGDAVDVAADEVESGGTVGLGTAGRTLIAADHALATRPTRASENRSGRHTRDELEARRDTLRGHVEAGVGHARDRAGDVLGAEDNIDAAASEAAIAAAEERFDGNGRRAVAIANGSFARAIAEEAAARGEYSDVERDILAARLRVEFAGIPKKHRRVPASDVERTAGAVREISQTILTSKAEDEAGDLTREAAERALGDGYKAIPAGLPLVPVPGYWVATVNVWHVQVRGTYGRFTLREHDGTPERPGGTTYVRDGSTVRLDTDDDGTAERLGRSDRIAFETSTVVVIAVPPGGRGVGDVDGNADERSDGWPCPGPAAADGPPCADSGESSR